MKFLAGQEEGWSAHAYHTKKISPGLRDRQWREKQAETEKFNSVKRNALRCWAWSQNQSILQHRSPAHLETVKKGIISTKAVTGKRANFFLKQLCLQGTEQHWGEKPKPQVLWNISEALSKSDDRMIFHASCKSSACTE